MFRGGGSPVAGQAGLSPSLAWRRWRTALSLAVWRRGSGCGSPATLPQLPGPPPPLMGGLSPPGLLLGSSLPDTPRRLRLSISRRRRLALGGVWSTHQPAGDGERGVSYVLDPQDSGTPVANGEGSGNPRGESASDSSTFRFTPEDSVPFVNRLSLSRRRKLGLTGGSGSKRKVVGETESASPPTKRAVPLICDERLILGLGSTLGFTAANVSMDRDLVSPSGAHVPGTPHAVRYDGGCPVVESTGRGGKMADISGAGQSDVVYPPQPLSASPVIDPAAPAVGGSRQLVVSLPGPDPCELCGALALSVPDLIDHLMRSHGVRDVQWACRKCLRTRPKRHQIDCHLPKCNGRVSPRLVIGPRFWCNVCVRTFLSVRGLSQHKRHAHPAAYLDEVSRRDESRQLGSAAKLVATRGLKGLAPQVRDMPSTNPVKVMTSAPGSEKTREMVRLKHRSVCKTLQRQEGALRQLVGSRNRLIRKLVAPNEPPEPANEVGSLLREAVRQGVMVEGSTRNPVSEDDCRQGAIASVASMLIRRLGKKKTGSSMRTGLTAPHSINMGTRSVRRRRKRRFLYRLLRTNITNLALYVLDGHLGTTCPIPLSEITSVFKSRWSKVDSFKGLGQFVGLGSVDNSVFGTLITPIEVNKNLRSMKSKTSPGPDGISKRDLLDWDPEGFQLSRIFSAWLVSGSLPRVFKECRTVLIPKTTDRSLHADVNQWRPITIASVVLRLFSRILTKRMTVACPIHPRQRGFVASAGCSENLALLEGFLKLSRKEKRSISVVFVDFAKAFDTVSHEHLLSALKLKGLDRHMLELVKDSYEDCVTQVRCAEGDTAQIAIKVGVKQGDSMSPLLFNLALDPLIQILEREGQGFAVGDGIATTAIAFADDLALLSDSWEGMVTNIAVLEAYCQLTGLQVQPRKCCGFSVDKKAGGSLSINTHDPWVLGGESLRWIGPDDRVKYLGVEVSPWKGVVSKDPSARIQKWILAIGEAPLDPIEKVLLLNNYAVPRIIFEVDHCMASAKTLTEMDRNIKCAIKKWLHLPMCTTDGLLYSRKRDGGLGIVRLARVVPSIQVRRLYKLLHSPEVVISTVACKTINRKSFVRAWLSAGGSKDEVPSLDPPGEGDDRTPIPEVDSLRNRERAEELNPVAVTPNCKRLVPCDWRQVEFDRWTDLGAQGKGVRVFEADRVSNCWLLEPRYRFKKSGQLVAALQLRANVYPTRELLARGRPSALAVVCRHCRGSPETCSHILGACPKVQLSRIKRHHKVCDLLVTEAERLEWVTLREKRWTGPDGGTLAPDLVFIKSGVALIVDVTIRYELGEESLEMARTEKVEKYRPLCSVLVRDMPAVRRAKVFGFPVGARGKWPPENGQLLIRLGLTQARCKSFAKLVSCRSLSYSLDILREFMMTEPE